MRRFRTRRPGPCESFDPDCPGCQPALIDVATGKILGAKDPLVVALLPLWRALPRSSQEACWRVWVKNSRSPADLAIMTALFKSLSQKMEN